MSNDKLAKAVLPVVYKTCDKHVGRAWTMLAALEHAAYTPVCPICHPPAAKVEPVADSPEQSSASTPTKLGSGPSQEGAVGSDATTSSGPDEVAALRWVSDAYAESAKALAGTHWDGCEDAHYLCMIGKQAALIERLAADLATMTAERDDAFARALEFRLTELDAVRAERDAALVRGQANEKRAARYAWWRDNIGLIQDDEDGIQGVAFAFQIPLSEIHKSYSVLMDKIADAAIAKGAP